MSWDKVKNAMPTICDDCIFCNRPNNNWDSWECDADADELNYVTGDIIPAYCKDKNLTGTCPSYHDADDYLDDEDDILEKCRKPNKTYKALTIKQHAVLAVGSFLGVTAFILMLIFVRGC